MFPSLWFQTKCKADAFWVGVGGENGNVAYCVW
jgi:hypothetical protein